MPRMFEEDFLQKLLSNGKFVFILDRACIQFEPDHPDYHRITTITYEHINAYNEFEKLRSTRHFGPMVFYLAWFKKIDNLLCELLETVHIEEVNNLLLLYGKIHNLEFNIKDNQDINGITEYIAKEAQKKAPLELALQAYKDLDKQRKQLEQGIKAAHGYTD